MLSDLIQNDQPEAAKCHNIGMFWKETSRNADTTEYTQ